MDNGRSLLRRGGLSRHETLERPLAFGLQLSNPCGITHIETTPLGVLPGEVDGTATGLSLFRALHERFGRHPCQYRDIANR